MVNGGTNHDTHINPTHVGMNRFIVVLAVVLLAINPTHVGMNRAARRLNR